MESKDFEIGDLVWAKMKGYPYWPGKVISPEDAKQPSKKGHHCIYFFGSKNYSLIQDANIKYHSEEMLQDLAKRKYAYYQDGVEEIIKESKLAPKKQKPTPKVTIEEKKQKPSPKVKVEEVNQKDLVKIKPAKSLNKSKLRLCPATPKRLIPKSPMKRSLSIEDDLDYPASRGAKKADNYSSLRDNVLPSIGATNVAVISPYSIFNQPHVMHVKHVRPSEKYIGFLGIGMMGHGIVKNLLRSGHNVSIWNRTSEKCDSIELKGAKKCATAADVVRASDITFCCVSDPHAVRTIVFGDHGVLKGFEKQPVKGYVEMTSIDADTSQEIAEAITGAGMKYLEAPIIGSRTRAEDGTILILGSGDRALFNDCETCFHAMSNHAYYISCDVGKSANINIITSMFLGTMYVALAEALSLTESVKLSQSDLLEILELRGITCPPLIEKGKAILEKNFAPNISLKHQQKDLNLALNLSHSLSQPMPVTTAANEVYKHAKSLGCTDQDAAAVYLGTRF